MKNLIFVSIALFNITFIKANNTLPNNIYPEENTQTIVSITNTDSTKTSVTNTDSTWPKPNVDSVCLCLGLLDFEVKNREEVIELTWSASTDIINDTFIVQKSSDGINFTDLDKVSMHSINGDLLLFEYVDNNPNFIHIYYRLKYISNGNEFEYSKIKDVIINNRKEMKFQNPIGANLILQNAKEGDVISFYNTHGILLFTDNMTENYSKDLSQYTNGLYLMNVTNKEENFAYSSKIYILK